MASRIFSSGLNNLVRQSVTGRAQQRYFSQTSRPLQNQTTNPEDNLPPDLRAIRPIPKSVWVTLFVTGALSAYVIPWKSWIQHIFYPPPEDDGDD
jgi:hypothetical protein